jgi:DNA replication protein DnaC
MDREQKRLELEERMERKRRIQRTYARSLVADSIQDATLENFTYRDGTGIALTKSKEFVKHFSTRKTGILLFGKPGNGKSHLARGMEQAIDAMHYATLFLDWLKLCELAKATFSRNSKTTIADYVTAAVEADFLVLDELGAGTLSDFEFKNLLFPIVNGRQGKKTVYTTNLDIKRLAAWMAAHDPDGRIIDRIIGSCEIVQNSGTSKRVEDAEKRMST